MLGILIAENRWAGVSISFMEKLITSLRGSALIAYQPHVTPHPRSKSPIHASQISQQASYVCM